GIVYNGPSPADTRSGDHDRFQAEIDRIGRGAASHVKRRAAVDDGWPIGRPQRAVILRHQRSRSDAYRPSEAVPATQPKDAGSGAVHGYRAGARDGVGNRQVVRTIEGQRTVVGDVSRGGKGSERIVVADLEDAAIDGGGTGVIVESIVERQFARALL